MAKIKVTIEETVSKDFEIEVPENEDVCKYIEQMYKDEKLVVDDGNLTSVQYSIEDVEGMHTDWIEM